MLIINIQSDKVAFCGLKEIPYKPLNFLFTKVATSNLSQTEIEAIKESLRRCTPETVEAAIDYRASKNASLVPTIVTGIIERFLEPDLKPLMKKGDDSLTLFDDLGVDSLTMMEIVILVEETIGISVENEELRELRSIGDVKTFIASKLTDATSTPGEDVTKYPITSADILESMQYQDPFLFVQQAAIEGKKAKGTYYISGEEGFLQGHFKNNPVFPASISLEALGQLAVLFLIKTDPSITGGKVDPKTIYFTSCDGIRCHKECKPGVLFEMETELKRLRHPMATFEGNIKVNGEKVVFAEEITLLFDYQK